MKLYSKYFSVSGLFFFYYNVFKIYPCCSISQSFIPFYGWIVFHCIDRLYFVYPFICWWILGLFLPFSYCYERGVQTSVWISVFNSFGLEFYLGGELVSCIVVLCLTFWEPPNQGMLFWVASHRRVNIRAVETYCFEWKTPLMV